MCFIVTTTLSLVIFCKTIDKWINYLHKAIIFYFKKGTIKQSSYIPLPAA